MKKEEIYKKLSETANSTVLSFPDRGPWGNKNYRGNFSGWIPASLIYRYDVKSVSEIFAGGGTTSDVCKDLKVAYCGIDLNPEPVRKDIISMDILDFDTEFPEEFYSSELQILHPPYPSINDIQYADSMWKGDELLNSRDIQQMDWKRGMAAVNQAVLRGFSVMEPGSRQAIVVGDIRKRVDGKSVFRSMLSELAIPGELDQILIKMQHNTMSERKTKKQSYYKRGFFLIEHEYVVVIKKPSGYEIAYTIPHRVSADIRDSVKTATWKTVVYSVLRELGHDASLDEIYDAIKDHKKAKSSPEHWKAKVRQVLQQLEKSGQSVHKRRGVWAVA